MTKYKFKYTNIYYSKDEAIDHFDKFIENCKINDIDEKSFGLYFFDEMWHIYANSKRHEVKGELIKESEL